MQLPPAGTRALGSALRRGQFIALLGRARTAAAGRPHGEGRRAAGGGIRLPSPEGTFYLIPRCPVADEAAFAARLAAEGVWVMPGSVAGLPGRLRISLTATN